MHHYCYLACQPQEVHHGIGLSLEVNHRCGDFILLFAADIQLGGGEPLFVIL